MPVRQNHAVDHGQRSARNSLSRGRAVRDDTLELGVNGSMFMAAGLSAALALVSALLPQRGLQDRLAGTWPVLR